MSGAPPPEPPAPDAEHAALMAKYMNHEQYPESALRSSLRRLAHEGLPGDDRGTRRAVVRTEQGEGKRPKIILRIGKK
ncbi:hypothetical protein PsYK624_080380 [Phanerochaete sordida]|uniref:Uncharacterized protein n=1 Tax=Phanerochaete sordida TaxID=48140 RepID=A0A9P3LFC7_9APHY|nr:hypothetical protein PsYK624_080380 [Phanerochaete sordida]